MAKPSEEEKLAKKTTDVVKGKMHVKGREVDIDITVETTPNANGGYDTKVKVPVCPIGATVNQ